jgi:hypothetical protein
VRADGSAAMSPDQSEGVFDALGWAGDEAREWAVRHHAGPMTERINGLVLKQSGSTKPSDVFGERLTFYLV